MSQERLIRSTVLNTENELARNINFDDVIDSFAANKARKGVFLWIYLIYFKCLLFILMSLIYSHILSAKFCFK